MWILPVLGVVGLVVGFAFMTLAIGTSHTTILRVLRNTMWKRN